MELFDLDATVRVEGAVSSSKQEPAGRLLLQSKNWKMGFEGEPQADGRLKFEALRPDVYQLFPSSEEEFVRRILVDGEVQNGRKVDLTHGKPKSMEIVLSSAWQVCRLE